jgi:uncharacterized protein (DUF1697 family)
MAELRALAESLGFGEVATYIQSGNLLFASPAPPAPRALEAAIAERFGLSVPVVLRSAAELAAAVASNPFAGADLATLHLGFLASPPEPGALDGLDGARFLPERFSLKGRELYLELPAGMGRAKLPAVLDRRLPMTVRNWKTVAALAELATG